MTNTTDAAEPRATKSKRSRQRSVKIFLRDVLLIVLAAILISFLIKTFLIRSFYIPSGSMENTLQVDDRIIVNELEPNLVPISRGDVVVFTDPGGWLDTKPIDTRTPFQQGVDNVLSFIGLTANDLDDHLIKRVIGLPGDHVTCCNDFGQIEVNGVALDEPYIRVTAADGKAVPGDFDVTVPAGKLWVLGDNRDESADSFNHIDNPDGGFVPVSDVVGRAFVITWPVSRWSWLSDYPDTFAGIPSGTSSSPPPTKTSSGTG